RQLDDLLVSHLLVLFSNCPLHRRHRGDRAYTRSPRGGHAKLWAERARPHSPRYIDMTMQAVHVKAAMWMHERFMRQGELHQDEAANEIKRRFGDECVYENVNGNLAISPYVLKAFFQATERTAVWEASAKYWRRREKSDGP